jgi:hypothetical protein
MIFLSVKRRRPPTEFVKKAGTAVAGWRRSGLIDDLRRVVLSSGLVLSGRPRTGALDAGRSGFADRLVFLTVGDPLQQPG